MGPSGGPGPLGTLRWVELGGAVERLRSWMGGEPPGLRAVGGAPGPGTIGIAVAGREVVLR